MQTTKYAFLVAALLLPAIAPAASIQGPRRSALERLEEGEAIRKRLQLRGGRFEATPSFGFTLNDAFQRNFLFGIHLAYHLSDSWAIGGTAYGGTAFNTDLADRIDAKRGEKVDAGAFSNVGFLGSVEVSYTPLIGKFALFGRKVMNYDISVTLGVGGASVSGSPDVEELTVAPMFGVGVRTFFTEWGALVFEVRDYIYSSALNAVPTANDEGGTDNTSSNSFRNNFMLGIGFAFFLPTEPEVGK